MTLLSEDAILFVFPLTLSLQRVSGQENYVEAADCERIAPNREQTDKTAFMSSQVSFPSSFSLSLPLLIFPFWLQSWPSFGLVSSVHLVNKVTH